MEDSKETENHTISAAAFVEGGIQDACDDACSICLEEFCESDPSTVTSCKHEFHLQCVLEWCQRSPQCPMCWQPISLKDHTSQELLEAVERERSIRANPPRNATIFQYPTLGDFELQHHLTAAAAMGRAHRFGRREGHRNRLSTHGHPHFFVFATHPGASPLEGGETEPARIAAASPSAPLSSGRDGSSQHILQFPSIQTDQNSFLISGSPVVPTNRHGYSVNDRTSSQIPSPNQDRAGPSDFQSFSEFLKSRFNEVSMRYKESISKSTRGWKERFFSRSTSMSGTGSEVRTENTGIASVSCMMKTSGIRESYRSSQASVSSPLADCVGVEQNNQNNQNNSEMRGAGPLKNNNAPSSFSASSFSN